LHIDIEVDEPYVYHTKHAIHYDTSEKDYKRNQFFADKGWIVIRFSEQQVVCHPDSCCKTVAQKIAQVTGDRSTMSILVDIPELPQQKQWTETEAIQMAARRERDNYQTLVKEEVNSETNQHFSGEHESEDFADWLNSFDEGAQENISNVMDS
ncbi:MAG: DUF559 domain-containing protein, partial [Phormidesmis sp.]